MYLLEKESATLAKSLDADAGSTARPSTKYCGLAHEVAVKMTNAAKIIERNAFLRKSLRLTPEFSRAAKQLRLE